MNNEALTIPALEALLRAPTLAILAVDKQGCVILWSASATRMYGWTESEVLGRFLPIVPEEQRQAVHDRIRRELKGETFGMLDVRGLRRDGSLVDVSLWTTPLRDAEGEVIGMLGLHVDITARRRVEGALREAEAELRRVLAAVSDYIYSGEFDSDGRFFYHYYSPAVERIMGRSPLFFLTGPERWLSAVHPEDRHSLAQAFARLQSGQSTSEEKEYRIILPDGAIRWVRDSVIISQGTGARRFVNGVVSDITARKQSEEALRESEARFRGIFMDAPSGIVLVSREGRFLHANPAFCEFLGYSEPELFSKTVGDVTHPDDRERTSEVRQAAWEGQEPLVSRLEKRYVRKDGRVVWGEVSISLVRDARGQAVHSISHVLDITERKLAEAALKRSEERFRALIQHGFDAIAVVRADATVQFASESTSRALGYEPDDLAGRDALEFVHPEDLARITEAFNELLQSPGGNMNEQFRCRHKDGSWRWLEVSGTNCLAQPHVDGIILNYHDITPRKQTEEVLRESEEKYRTLAESAPDAIYIINREDRVQYANTHAASMIGKTPQELVGRRRADLFPPETSQHQRREIEAVFESGKPRHVQNRTSVPGGELWLDTQLAPLRGTGDAVRAVMGISRDVTDQKRAEEALRQSEERYRTMVEAIPYPVWRCNAEGQPVDGNIRWCEYTGQTPEEALGNRWVEALHPDDVGGVLQKMQEAIANRGVYQAEYRLRRASDGSYRWHLGRGLPVKDKDGLILCWFGSAVDIDDQKRAEETLRRAHDELEKLVEERTEDLVRANAALVQEVTERQHAEEALRESETRYRTLVEEIPAITYIAALDEASTTLYISPQVEQVLGFTPADYRANPDSWRQHVHPADSERVMAQLRRTQRSGGPFDCEYRMLDHSGNVVWVRDKAVVVRNEAGQPLVLQGVMLDVTERLQAEETMQLQSTALEAAANGIVITDREGRILWINPAFAKLTGYKPSEVIGKNPRVLKSGQHTKAFYRNLWQTVLSGRVWHGEIINKRKNGSLYTEEMTITPVCNAAGEITHFIAIKQDITEWKLAEESRRYLAAIVESSEDAIVSAALGGTIASWNAAAQRLYNYAAKEILGRSVFTLVPRNRRAEIREIRKKVQGGERLQHYETVRLKKGGFPVDVSVTASAIKDDSGRVIGISTITRDISERKELERAVVEASSQEQARIGQDLHDGVCQELTGIGFLWKAVERSVAERALPDPATVAEIGRLITKTIREARDLARGLCPAELESNDLGVALKSLGSLMERLFAVSCVVRCQQSVLLADKAATTHLYRIAQEAVSNAIRHGQATRIWIRLVWKKNKLTLRIRDNGKGFSKRQAVKRGIGIRSMRYRANLIGSLLAIESQPGAGTIVTCVYTQSSTQPVGKARLHNRD
ncbi:MAG TPA: PAS domain S-box protein [Verrucomicrobiae bacterium]|nr:PAS domain S-box protein [Verrucomicrobiae bacterium]